MQEASTRPPRAAPAVSAGGGGGGVGRGRGDSSCRALQRFNTEEASTCISSS